MPVTTPPVRGKAVRARAMAVIVAVSLPLALSACEHEKPARPAGERAAVRIVDTREVRVVPYGKLSNEDRRRIDLALDELVARGRAVGEGTKCQTETASGNIGGTGGEPAAKWFVTCFTADGCHIHIHHDENGHSTWAHCPEQ
jgi:hypothetical protein